ncbi:MAG TPA: hypothetical protein VMX96_07110 [Dehalococcoidia bacterium]|nr:hypothetical protein [Dehalococcoidia bacterium]
MTKKGPDWAKTNESWETRKEIWAHWAYGDNVSKTVIALELEGRVIHRDTIRAVRDELLELPVELLVKLVSELPEVQSLVEKERPDAKGRLKSGQHDDSQQVESQVPVPASIYESALQKHFINLKDIGIEIMAWSKDFCKIEQKSSSKGKVSKLRRLNNQRWHFKLNPLFKYLKQHIPDSELWNDLDQLEDMIDLYIQILPKKDKSIYLTDMRKLLNKDCPEPYWDSQPDDEIYIMFKEWMWTLARRLFRELYLYIPRIPEVICDACPRDYRTEFSQLK